MPFLIVQSTYNDIQIGLCDYSRLISYKIIFKFDVCKQLIPAIQELLHNNGSTLQGLEYIGINQGPAPFNTLRVLISTINGIAYATKVPLVRANGIKALYNTSRSPQTVVLLNAFNNEVYYAYKKQTLLTIGVARLTDILQSILLDLPHGTITFVGNGTLLFKDQLISAFGSRVQIAPSEAHELSLATLAEICTNKFKQGEQQEYVQPLYLKRPV